VGNVESIFDIICGEFAGLARMRDFDILWGYGANHSTDIKAEEVEAICEDFISKGVAGIVFAPLEGHESDMQANQNIALRLKRAGIPFVLLDRDIVSFPQRSSFDLISLDNFRAGYVIAEHLIRLGVQRIVFFSRPLSAESVVQRRAGVVAALVAHQIPMEGQFAFEGDPSDAKTVSSFVRNGKFEAVICANDHTAAQFAQSLNKLSVRIPVDLRIVGFDDFRLASLLPVPLTTIKQPCRDIATIAFNALQERILDPAIPARCLLAAPQLIVRESCGGYMASASVTKVATTDQRDAGPS
jgi:LacI family transcriptional regulator